MSSKFITIKIRIGNNIRVEWNSVLMRWAHSDNDITWKYLPSNITNSETAIAYVMRYYQLDN